MILYNCPYEMAERKIRKIQKEFSSGQTKEYPKSFSCGIVEVEGGNEELQVRDIIKQADHEMYLQKKEHKKKVPERTECDQYIGGLGSSYGRSEL